MTQANEALVRRLLGEVADSHTGAPLAEAVRAVGVDGARVSVDLQLGYPAAGAAEDLGSAAAGGAEGEGAALAANAEEEVRGEVASG